MKLRTHQADRNAQNKRAQESDTSCVARCLRLKPCTQLVAAFVLLLATGGCQWSEDRFLERDVTPGDLVGAWILRAESERDLRSMGVQLEEARSSHRLEIGSDGLCEIQTILPDAVRMTGPPPARVHSGCRWSVTDSGRHQQLSLVLTAIPGKTTRYYFTETSDEELVIWQYIGDPDSWRYLEYSKAEPSQSTTLTVESPEKVK